MNDEAVRCEDCKTLFPARFRWESSLPPHNCTERAMRRQGLVEHIADALIKPVTEVTG